MRTLLYPLTLGILLTMGVGRVASADPILVTDGRLLAVDATLNGRDPIFDGATPSAPFAPFDEVATATDTDGSAMAQSTATQRSSVSPTRFSASGSAESFVNAPNVGNVAGGAGGTIFDITFDLPTPSRFAVTGFLAVSAFDQSNGEPQEIIAFLSNESIPGEPQVFFDGIGFGTLQLNHTGFLRAGTYRLYAEANTESNGVIDPDSGSEALSHHKSTFDLDFQLTPVPEPGSMILLGSGLVAFAARRVRRAATVRT